MGVCGLANLKPKSPDTHLITKRRGFSRAHFAEGGSGEAMESYIRQTTNAHPIPV